MARIVHISEALATGVLSAISTFVNAQIADGHEVTLVGSIKRSDTQATWREEFPNSLNFIEIDMTREISLSSDFKAIWKIRSILTSIRPDVVHLHSSKAGAVGRIAAMGLPITVVYQPHGLSFLRRDISATERFLFKAIEGLLSLIPAHVVACSKGEADAARQVIVKKRVKLIDNAVKLEGISRSALALAPITIGTCGRIAPQKNPLFFVEVAKLVGQRAQFVWIGDGDVPERLELEKAGVHVTGWCTRAEALGHISALTIYIQTSAWEGMPISVIEAMGAGLPVIATDIVGNRDLVENGKTGFLVKTPQEMADRIIELIDTEGLIPRLGQCGYQTARDKYSASSMISAYYSIYAQQPSATASSSA